MRIEELEVPESVKQILKRDVEELFPPQVEAIKKGVLTGKNIVLGSPTASGKTLVAELCAMKHILEREGKVLYLSPLRALASEKFEEFKKFREIQKPSGQHVKVAISTGDYDSSDHWLEDYDIIITTNEKLDSLLRHKARWIKDVSLIIADEIHLLNDPERGPTLEVVLTRLKQVNSDAQILALGACIPNLDEIAEWLNASFIASDWRPVKLLEGVYLNGTIQFVDNTQRKVEAKYKDNVANLVLDILSKGGQVLIFKERRKSAERLAKELAPKVRRTLSRPELRTLEKISNRILEIGEKTRLSEALSESIKSGVAFHHAGLHPGHRKLIEDCFRERKIKVISATPTLAFGVNLPARAVIIHHKRYMPGYGSYPISTLEYKQMAGRAGRPKYDKVGESILIAESELERDLLFEYYIYSTGERIESRLNDERILRIHTLATIASGFASSEEEVLNFFNESLCAHQYGLRRIQMNVLDAIDFLVKEGMLEKKSDKIVATKFGRRVSELYIDPESAIIIRNCLNSMPKSITEFSLLHLISRTPDLSPKYYPARKEKAKLSELFEKRFDELMIESFEEHHPNEYEEHLAELKMARILEDWINEVPEDSILEEFGIQTGDLFRLVETARWLLYATCELAKLLGRNEIVPIVSTLEKRVEKGIKAELIPLASLRGIGRVRARLLYNAGFRTVQDLKEAPVSKLLDVPTIGPEIVKSIKEQVGVVTLKPEEWKLLKRKRHTVQTSLA